MKFKIFKKKDNDEFINLKEELKESSFINIRSLLDGSLFSHDLVFKQLPFLFFITILILFYIGIKYEYNKTYGELMIIKKEVSELRYKSNEYGLSLMKMNRLTEIEKRVKDVGLDIEPITGSVTKIIVAK